LDEAMGLEVEVARAVGDDVIFVLIVLHLHARQLHLEQVRGGSGGERKTVGTHQGLKPGVAPVVGADEIAPVGCYGLQYGPEIRQFESQKLCRQHEIFTQQIEPAEDTSVGGKQGFAKVEAEQAEAGLGQRDDNGIASLVEIAEVDSGCACKQLLMK